MRDLRSQERPCARRTARLHLAHTMTHLPNIQMSLRPGTAALGWGHPDFALLPAGDLERAAVEVLRRHAGDALSYGASQGPSRLLEPLASRISPIDGRAAEIDRLLITA